MSTFVLHTPETAPAGSREQLRQIEASLGRIPNLAAAMAESPSFLRGFFTLREIYHQGTLTPLEIHLLSLVNAAENGCAWCVAFHSAMALKEGLPEPALKAVRAGGTTGDARLDALAGLSRALIATRGDPEEAVLADFYAAGFAPAQVLEVILGVGFSVMANYAGHLTHPPLDRGFERFAWEARTTAS